MENKQMEQSKPIKILVEEHKNILNVAAAIEKECNSLNQGQHINDDFFKEIIDFIRNYADKFHHAKEEDILFKELCKDEVQAKMHCNPLDQMLYEHDQGRSFVKELEEGMNERNRQKVIQNAKAYMRLIRDHISKEDNILYPMADEALDNEKKKQMLKQFNKIAKERAKQEKKYINFVESLQ
jgi:hemerythrin-like domain-containing protein